MSLREKCSNTEFFLVRTFPYSDQKKLRIWTLFTQCADNLNLSKTFGKCKENSKELYSKFQLYWFKINKVRRGWGIMAPCAFFFVETTIWCNLFEIIDQSVIKINHLGIAVILTAQLHSSKPELVFYTGSNPARGVSKIRDGENL